MPFSCVKDEREKPLISTSSLRFFEFFIHWASTFGRVYDLRKLHYDEYNAAHPLLSSQSIRISHFPSLTSDENRDEHFKRLYYPHGEALRQVHDDSLIQAMQHVEQWCASPMHPTYGL